MLLTKSSGYNSVDLVDCASPANFENNSKSICLLKA